MHNQAVLSAAAASTICFRDTNSSHQFIWASILNIHPCMSHERQHRRQTSNRMVRYAVLYMQQYHNNRCLGKSSILPSAKQSLRCSPPPDQHTPCDPQMSSNRKKCFHVKICNTPTKTKTLQFAAGECCCYSIVNEHHDALAIDDTTSRASAVSPPPARPKGSTVQQASPSQTCKQGNVPMSMKQVNRRIPTMLDVAFKNTSNLF